MNPYSVLHNYDNVRQYTPNFGLIGSVLQYKQGNLDENRKALESLADSYVNLDIYRDVDKQYANQRIKTVLDITNQYASMDLSDAGLATQLRRNINQVMDENVQNAVYSTKVFRAEQAEWEDARKNKQDKYSDDNRRYALRFSEQWRNSDQVGEVYGGGGGFREYINVEKLISDKMPELAKTLEWEYQVDGQGKGMFRERLTKKEVDRGRMEQAIEGMLDPKAREQLKINAWAKYDAIPEEAIKASFTAKLSAEIENDETHIGKLRALMEAQTNPDVKQQYVAAIEAAENRLGQKKAYDPNKLSKEQIYQSTYMEEFKNQYLYAYSYDPITVKSEVNDLDVAVFDADIKLRTQAREDAKFAYQKEKDKEDQRLKELELQIKAKGKKMFEGDLQNGALAIAEVVKSTGEIGDDMLGDSDRQTAEEYGYAEERASINGMKNLFSSYGLSETDLRSPEFVAHFKNLKPQDKISFKVNGKQVVLDMTNPTVNRTVNNYYNNVIKDNPVRQKAYKESEALISNTINALAKSFGTGDNEFDFDNPMPDFKTKFVNDGKGGFKVVKLDPKFTAKYNYMEMLLTKKGQGKKLTADETASLEYMTGVYLAANTKKESGQYMFDAVQRNIYSKVSSGLDLLPKDNYRNKAAQSGIVSTAIDMINKYDQGIITADRLGSTLSSSKSGYETNLKKYVAAGEYLKKNNLTAEQRKYYTNLQTQIKTQLYKEDIAGSVRRDIGRSKDNISTLFGGYNLNQSVNNPITEDDISKFKPQDFDADELVNWGSANKGINDYIKSFETSIANESKRFYDSKNMVPSRQYLNYSSKTETYGNILTKIGYEKSMLNNAPITLIPSVMNGKPTGEYEVYVKQADKDSETGFKDVALKVLSKEDADALGLTPKKAGQAVYDATYGEAAPSVPMGGVDVLSVNPERLTRLRQAGGNTLPFYDMKNIITYANTRGVGKEVATYYDMAQKGEFEFKLESNGTEWVNNIYLKGKLWGSNPIQRVILQEEDVLYMQATSELHNQNAFNAVMNQKIENLASAKIINASK